MSATQFSQQTQNLITTAQQAGGSESDLAAKVQADGAALAQLQQQAAAAQQQLATDTAALQDAETATTNAFIMAAQSMMQDLGITSAVTIPAPTPPAPATSDQAASDRKVSRPAPKTAPAEVINAAKLIIQHVSEGAGS